MFSFSLVKFVLRTEFCLFVPFGLRSKAYHDLLRLDKRSAQLCWALTRSAVRCEAYWGPFPSSSSTCRRGASGEAASLMGRAMGFTFGFLTTCISISHHTTSLSPISHHSFGFLMACISISQLKISLFTFGFLTNSIFHLLSLKLISSF